ncbi:hypothetical protein [Thalassobacillus sp. CUG 92003]|uniref:hypothetical protein n=1 Tax=Thalassobacillus sp. CUG 92003 TaxID=2736641 RepID=UPI0015E6FE9A|nr:hypothetical protein [Thalassobacillus sp. CUG 92003]
MVLYPKKTISINGAIYNVNVNHDQFLDEFVEWVESKGWTFMGMTDLTTEDKASDDLLSFIEGKKQNEDHPDQDS